MKGKAIGSGLAYALAADVRIADPTLEISIGANRMGVGFDRLDLIGFFSLTTSFVHQAGGADIGLGYLLPKIAGFSAAAELMLTFRWIKAERCLRVGVVSDIVPADKLVEEGRQLARDMLEMSHAVIAFCSIKPLDSEA
jgi:enoyl-CoA hydratase/carnithine racemase